MTEELNDIDIGELPLLDVDVRFKQEKGKLVAEGASVSIELPSDEQTNMLAVFAKASALLENSELVAHPLVTAWALKLGALAYQKAVEDGPDQLETLETGVQLQHLVAPFSAALTQCLEQLTSAEEE